MSSTDPTERLGLFAVGLLAEQAGWAFRELPRPDNGVDASIEARTDGAVDGRQVGLQIRSGESHFQHPIPGGGWRYYIPITHATYWTHYAMPVLLVLYNPREEKAYWQLAHPDILRATPTQFALDVPASNVFDQRSGRDLEQIVADREKTGKVTDLEDGLIGRDAVFDLDWMQTLEAGEPLFLEAEQDHKAGNGRCFVRLVGVDDAGEQPTLREWRWAFLPGPDFGAELVKLFPWADKKIDAKTYREAAVPDFLVEECRWNDDDAAYEYDADFDEWFSARYPPGYVNAYATAADGSISFWRLELTLNDLGRKAVRAAETEIMEDAFGHAANHKRPEPDRRGGYYTTDFLESARSRGGGVELLIFMYGSEDEDGFDRDTLLAEPSLFSGDGELIPEAGAAILRHASGRAPSKSLVRVFGARFADALNADDGFWKITVSEVEEWLDEVGSIARYGAGPAS